jgi:glutathione S-transferase
LNGAHLKPEFKAINPASTVPALVDGDLKLFDSSAIATYLVDKYAKEDSLFPKDVVKRAKVNEKLFYVASTVFPCIFGVFFPVIFETAVEVSETSNRRLHRIYDTIEAILSENVYLTGTEITLPDLYLWCLTESIKSVIPIDSDKYPKYTNWLEKMREHPCNDYQQEGVELHMKVYQNALERNQKAKQ